MSQGIPENPRESRESPTSQGVLRAGGSICMASSPAADGTSVAAGSGEESNGPDDPAAKVSAEPAVARRPESHRQSPPSSPKPGRPLFAEQKEFLRSNKDHLGLANNPHLRILFDSIDPDLGAHETVLFSSKMVLINPHAVQAAQAEAERTETTNSGLASGADEKAAGSAAPQQAGPQQNRQENAPARAARSVSLPASPTPTRPQSHRPKLRTRVDRPTKQVAFSNSGDLAQETNGMCVVTQCAVYAFPPPMSIDGKVFVVCNIYDRYLIQDLVLVSKPYVESSGSGTGEFAMRSDDVVLHFKYGLHLWVRLGVRGRGSELAEVLYNTFEDFTGIELPIVSKDSQELTESITSDDIADELALIRLERWAAHQLVMEGWLWHFRFVEVPEARETAVTGVKKRKKKKKKRRPKPKWIKRWFVLSADNTFMYFSTPEEMAGFRAKAASLGVLSRLETIKTRQTYLCNSIDLMDVDLRNMPSEGDPEGFRVSLRPEPSVSQGLASPIVHHWLRPVRGTRKFFFQSPKAKPSGLRHNSVGARSAAGVSTSALSKASWLHAMFQRVQIAHFGISHAKARANAYASTFHIRSKRFSRVADAAKNPSDIRRTQSAADLSAPSDFVLMQVQCPEGYSEGKRLLFTTPDNVTMEVSVPPGVRPNESFFVKAPRASQSREVQDKDTKELQRFKPQAPASTPPPEAMRRGSELLRAGAQIQGTGMEGKPKSREKKTNEPPKEAL